MVAGVRSLIRQWDAAFSIGGLIQKHGRVYKEDPRGVNDISLSSSCLLALDLYGKADQSNVLYSGESVINEVQGQAGSRDTGRARVRCGS
jgi:hypothetical protein